MKKRIFTFCSSIIILTGCTSKVIEVNYNDYITEIKKIKKDIKSNEPIFIKEKSVYKKEHKPKIKKSLKTVKLEKSNKNISKQKIRQITPQTNKMVDIQKWKKWKKEKYNFIIQKKNILSIKEKFGQVYNKEYKTEEFNLGTKYNIRKGSTIRVPFDLQNINFVKNWQGEMAILEGRSTMLIIQANKINNKKYLKKKNSIIGIAASKELFVSIIDKKTQKPIKPQTFFKG